MRGDEIETLIDDAARVLTEAPPAAAIRARVRQRIEQRQHVRGLLRSWQGVVAAAAVVVAAALTWLLSGHTGVESEPPASLQPVIQADVPPATMPERPSALQEVAAAAARPAPGADAAGQPPLVVELIEIDPLDDDIAVELEVMEIPMPLRADRLEIQPLLVE